MTEQQELAKKDQQKKLKLGVEYLRENDEIVISGAAGVGKTYTSKELAKKVIEENSLTNPNILVSAIAHQAVGVIRNSMGDEFENLTCKTFASAAHLKKRNTNDNQDFVYKARYEIINGKRQIIPSHLQLADVIIIDECSMLSEKDLKLIKRHKKPNAKIIYLGDPAQLKSVSLESKYLVSPVFDNFTLNLEIPFRYEGTIQKIATAFRKHILKVIESGNPDLANPNFILQYRNIKSDDVVFTKNFFEFYTNSMNSIKNNLDDIYHTKYIAYHKKNCVNTSQAFRNKMFPDKEFSYMEGDLLVSLNSYMRENRVLIENSQYLKIDSKRLNTAIATFIKQGASNKFKFFSFHKKGNEESEKIRFNELMENYTANDPNSIKTSEIKYWSLNFDNIYSVPFRTMDYEICKKYNKKTKLEKIKDYIKEGNYFIGNNHFNNTYDALDCINDYFCNMEYGYAVNAHKSQGSTYKNVFINYKDIISNKHMNNLEKCQAIYVAFTRASKKVTILW